MLLNTDGKLYLGAGDSGMVSKERKSFTYKDYIDEGTDYTIDSININLLYMTDVTGITVGDLVYQSSVLVANVTAVDTVNKTITISPAVSFTAGTCTIYKAIPSLVEFAPEYAGNIHLNKHYREVLLLFKEIFAQTANVGFKSNISQALERIELSGQSSGIWGLFGWGQAPWGGIPAQKIIRIYVPREKQRCAFIRVRFEYSIGYGKYLLDGVSYVFNPMSERVSR
jgi:hypothetical protein